MYNDHTFVLDNSIENDFRFKWKMFEFLIFRKNITKKKRKKDVILCICILYIHGYVIQQSYYKPNLRSASR